MNLDFDDEIETDDDMSNDDEPVTLKTIQKLTGKLAQKLRAFSSDEENKMSSNDVKYVINSVLSALDLNSLEDDDKEEIMSKFEGGNELSDEEPMDNDDMDVEDDDTDMGGEEVTSEPPANPEGEMEESNHGYQMNHHDDFDTNEFDTYQNLHHKYGNNKRNNPFKMGHQMDDIFSESKIEKVLSKYFLLSKDEKQLNESIKKEKINLNKKIKNLSESISQEVVSRQIIEKNPNAKFLGKTKKSILVFEVKNRKIGVSSNGEII